MPEHSAPLPPATFEFLIFSLKMQAEMHLGLIHVGGGQEGAPEPDFPAARHSIDMLAMLEEKTRNNLTTEEARLLENSLTELRFRYVQTLEASAKKPELKAETAETQQAGA
jgi:hypothetical protein